MVEGLLLIALWCSVPGNTTQNVNSCRERIFNCIEEADKNGERQDFIKCFRDAQAGDANEVAYPAEETGE